MSRQMADNIWNRAMENEDDAAADVVARVCRELNDKITVELEGYELSRGALK